MVLVDVDVSSNNFNGVMRNTKSYVNGSITNSTFADTIGGSTFIWSANIGRGYYPNPTTPTGYATGFEDGSSYFIFNGVTIPIGSTIQDATLTFTMQSGGGYVTGTANVYGRKTASPVTPTNPSFFTKARATAQGTFTISGTPTSTTPTQIQSDVQSIVQELVNTFDYNNDNMMFITRFPLTLQPTTVTPLDAKDFYGFVSGFTGGSNIANLTVNYTEGAPTQQFTIDAILFIRKEEFIVDASLILRLEATFSINALLLGDITIIRPISDISTGSWTDTRLGNQDTELWDELDEVTPDDNTTAVTATGTSPFEVKLESVPDPNFHFGHTVYVRAKVENSNGSSRNIVIRLFQGAIQIASENQPVLTSSYVTYSMELSEAQASAITDYSDLRVRVDET